ncbi:hypothetical protein [Nitrospirillum iridis]|uniref:Uncharacterized protein n=1 Tax=Nitrospirillum iridis TaxID=765888 RepID=A0A7X0ECT8_9PROT|nr:hypothetical protein [Nitrospirillum iridis]MBB6249659.1 hypothetical protein [Nitrospirillum iridis]
MNDASAKDPQTTAAADAETPEALRRREALRKMAQLAGVGGTTAAVLLTSRRSRAGS